MNVASAVSFVWDTKPDFPSHTPNPQIQGMEPRRGRLGARILPCHCGEKRRIKGV